MSNTTSFKEFQENFKSKLGENGNSQYLAKKEILAIDKLLNTPQTSWQNGELIHSFLNIDSVFDSLKLSGWINLSFKECFDNYLIYQNPDPENKFEGDEKSLNQALEFAKYYEWLTNIQAQNKLLKTKKSELSHKQKMLALYYLGLNFESIENKALATVLSSILELDRENTRKYSYYLFGGENKVRTKTNLLVLQKLFCNSGLIDIANKVKTDLDKIK